VLIRRHDIDKLHGEKGAHMIRHHLVNNRVAARRASPFEKRH
jgi:hypothetical protein